MAIILLENIRSTLNVGGIFRIADAINAEKILLVGYTPAPTDRLGRENTKLAKTALGSEKTVRWTQYQTAEEAMRDYPNHEPIVVEQTPTAIPYNKAAIKTPLYIFGNETEGVQQQTLQTVKTHIHLPMHGTKESLNVTTCAAVVLYHHRTQHNHQYMKRSSA